MTVTVGLLMMGHVPPHVQHIGGDYPDLYRALLEPLGADVVRYDIDEGRFPDDLHECDVWLGSPSRSSTYDDLAWIPDTEELLRRIVSAERPFVGICFGHQMLAQALGGRVAKSDGGWGVGVQDYEVVGRPAFFGPSAPATVGAIASHKDQVVEAPPGAMIWATSEYCPNAGMTVGERAWTFQGHPEFTAELADAIYASRVELLGADVVERARRSLARQTSRELLGRLITRSASTHH